MNDKRSVKAGELHSIVAWDGDNAIWPDTRERVAVLRPADDPRVSLALAQVALTHQNEDALRQAASGRMRFMGYLVRRDGKVVVVDDEGENPASVAAGDTLAALSDLTPLE